MELNEINKKEDKEGNQHIWVFNGERNKFPSAVFSDLELAKSWIEENKLTGTLTAYPIDICVYDWAISLGYFKPKRDDQRTAFFIGNFSSASQQHFHFEEGKP